MTNAGQDPSGCQGCRATPSVKDVSRKDTTKCVVWCHMLELQWGLGPCRFGWVVVVVELLDVVVLPEVVVVVVVGDVIAVRWSRNPRPKFVGVPSYDVMRAGPFRQSQVSQVQPR